MNKDSLIGKLFLLLPRYCEHFIDSRTRYKITNHNLSSDNEMSFNFLKQFFRKYRSHKCQKLVESFKKKKLKYLGIQAQNLQHNNFQKWRLDLITYIVLAKVNKSDKQIKNHYHTYLFWQLYLLKYLFYSS